MYAAPVFLQVKVAPKALAGKTMNPATCRHEHPEITDTLDTSRSMVVEGQERKDHFRHKVI